MSDTEVNTACPYCGVGCGLIARAGGQIAGDPNHPANSGRLCSKGAALAQTLDDSARLTRPVLDGQPVTWDHALDEIAQRFRETIAAHGPDSVAFYVSGQFLTEDYYAANKVMKGCIGSANIDTNSRLCMASTVAGHVRAFGEDLVPGVYEDWDEADMVVLVGGNTAWCHPVLHQRLQAARQARGTRVVVLDPRRTATAEAADLHLPLAADTDISLFNGLLAYLARTGRLDQSWVARHTTGLDDALAIAETDIDAVAAACGIDPEALETFYDWFGRTERVMTVWSQGVNQSETGTDKVNAIINCHLATGRIGRPGMGPFSVTGQPNAMGGREVGGLANQLAAHMRLDSAEDRERLARFWNVPAVPAAPGLKAVDLFEAVLDGRVKAIWIAGTNPAASMPRADRVRQALAACPFVVVADCWDTDTSRYAHALLPAAGWGEKDGTVTNSERRITRQRPFRAAPGEARPDWWMFAELARRMGFAAQVGWDSPAAIFREHAALSGFENDGQRVFDISALATLTDADYDSLRPVRWPLPALARGEGGRLFAAGGFPTPDGRARFVPVHAPAATPLSPDQFILNTGRIRDQWHTMTRTGTVPSLMSHTPEPTVAIHPADAARLHLAADDLLRIETDEAAILLRAEPRHSQRRGEVFVPMHWTDAFASTGPVARAVTTGIDPYSGQPAAKASIARLSRVRPTFHGLLFHRAGNALPRGCHWTRVPAETGSIYGLTGLEAMPASDAMPELLRDLVPTRDDLEWIELSDPTRRTFRAAAISDGRLHAVVFLAPDRISLPQPAAIVAALGTVIADSARARLLASRPGGAAATDGPRICVCFGVSRDAVRHAVVTHRLNNVSDIGRHLRAGTNCGSCIPELQEILRDVRVPV